MDTTSRFTPCWPAARFRVILLWLWSLPVLSVPAECTPSQGSDPEEPDFAFLTGSAYTQIKKSMQLIQQTSYRTRRFAAPDGERNEDEFVFFQRAEYGLTDRWELDVVTPGAGSRERVNGQTMWRGFAFADSTLGVRYRLFQEESAPFTFAVGPQLILPTGSVLKGTGNGTVGFAWDAAASKDWGGPVFLYSTFNYKLFPSADDPTPDSPHQFTLHALEWAGALSLRALERPGNGLKHDLHVSLEAGGGWEQQVQPGTAVGARVGELSWAIYPGIRYGLITSRKTLIEIGAAVPIGLGPVSSKRGIVVQFQFEKLFGPLSD